MGEDAVNNANAADLLTGLIPKVVELLGGHYPELASKQNLILVRRRRRIDYIIERQLTTLKYIFI